MKHSLHILYTLLFFLCGMTLSGYAQKVKIIGNVYGGGELAQVTAKDAETVKNQLIQDADLATLFDKEHTYTTYVHLGEDAEVYGRTFGGGKGQEDAKGEGAGLVVGQTDVALDGATVWSELYGGGEMADVNGNTLLHFKKGKAGHNAFGGGLGRLTETKENGVILPDNRQTVLASADIRRITEWTIDKITGESFVVFDGTEKSYTHYEFQKARIVNRDANGNPVKGIDGKYYTESDQFDPSKPEQLFSINHNIYGGGMTASQVEGKTFVHINYGMVNQEMMDFTYNGQKVWSMIYNSIANAQFCVFGGGYGYYTDILGDANVTMDVQGSGEYNYINAFTKWFAGEGKDKYGWDTNTGDPQAIYNAADEATWSHGAPGRSCMDIVGGGYNGKVLGSTNVTVGGDVVLRKVYGGGYYSSVGNTNVTVKSGIFNRVYGGGLIGNVYGKANLTIGQQGASEVYDANLHLLIKDAIYGGNDVSGTVGTTAPGEKTQTHGGVTYNVYDPVDDDAHGVRLNIYGGLVLGDVFGAGNGNHPGYTNPDGVQFHLSQHPSENYRQMPDAGTNGGTRVYKYRPRTGRVVMNIVGNAGADFNDIPTVDKVRIWGRTFGGGNSCNVGLWDGMQDDNAEVYSEGGTSWHPGDNFQGDGTIQINIGSHVQLGNRNDSHETPNGLFMGNNGQHMVTQTTDPSQLINYHHYWNPRSESYLPGFLVYDEDGTDIGRKAGLKSFAAFINNILTWTDNVSLNVTDDAEDIWMSNFVGGGYRGSMKAKSAEGTFAYTLPKGVTIGHSVVGGAFNAHVVYRIYAPDGNGYATDADGNYLFQTEIPDGWETDAEAKAEGKEHGNYLSQYTDGTILRYNFDGGIMGHESGSIAVANGARCNKVRNGAFDFTGDTKYDKSKALVQLDLRNRMEPVVIEAHDDEPAKVHGGIVYGGCFYSGYIDGDVWVDYRCSLSPLCTDKRFFSKTNDDMYGHVDNLEVHNALNVFGAGYGADTHTMGDTYLRILHNGTSSESYDYPFIYNAFGGGNMGTVAGNTNVYFNVGRKGTVVGSLYGGGYQGNIEGSTYVELAGGLLLNAYGGSREANIGGGSHVWAYDGANRPEGEGETSPENAPLFVGNIYGGNDISGTIAGGMSARWTEPNWPELTGKVFNSYVQVGGTEATRYGYPLIGNVFAGGNGEKTAHGIGAPDLTTTLLEVNGGSVIRAFGGGNKATVTSGAYIFVNTNSAPLADFTFQDTSQKDVINKTVLKGIYYGYKWEDTKLILDERHITNLFGGNNLTPMDIQPTWNLKNGVLGNVYSGGNLGDMTCPDGINITVSSPDVYIDNLYGGCRMANVVPTKNEDQNEDTFNAYWNDEGHYGATVTCTGGYIGNVYGGNDISGTVEHGTKVIIDGAVDNDVYCAGNGNYLYKWDDTVENVTETRDGDDIIYKVPASDAFGGAEATPTQKLLAINAWRPSVPRSSLLIAGAEDSEGVKVAFVKGNVYCGGNASTVTGRNSMKLSIGSHVNVHGLFMGSDGQAYASQEAISKLEKLNALDMTAATAFAPGDMEASEQQYYPTLLALYMKAVEVQSMPELTIDEANVANAYIGTFCGGGNRGSMTAQETVSLTIPANITIYDKIVAGCMDSNVKYVGTSAEGENTIEDVGGYYRPLHSGSTKLNYTINARFLPRYMSVPAGMGDGERNPEGDDFLTARGKYFLYENLNDEKTQYGVGNNIYGGCFESGDVLGDIVLNINSDMLEEPLRKEGLSQPNREKLNNSSRNEVAAFNVYGAGMGMQSNVWGNITINMRGKANNVYGGGRSGTVIGNATINMLNGVVYRHIIGGSDAGYLYGNTQIAVGYPTKYKTKVTDTYRLNRADQWNTDIENHDGTKTVVQDVRLVAGDIISEALYNMIAEGKNSATYFEEQAPDSPDWSNTDIFIGGGIYGGGYALATGSTVYAGDKTVRRFTDEYRPKNPVTGEKVSAAIVGYGGNATILVADDPANATTGGSSDHIAISTLVPVQKTGMSSKLGFFTKGSKTGTNALGDDIYEWTSQSDGAPATDGTKYYDLSGQGGIYGDGHLSFVEGFRSADIQRYGYAEYTPQHPKLMNTIQRLDMASIKDCCIMLQGARDFATNATDATIYSIARIGELQMHSTISDDDILDIGVPSGDSDNIDRIHEAKRSRNYLAFYNNVHYIGAVKSDVDFTSMRHDENGEKQSDTYREYKAGIIASNYGVDGTEAYNAFRTRNLGTARNMIGINNGYTLKIQNVQTVQGDNGAVVDKMYYGPVVGVFEAKLLSLVPGEGGGYIYADNVHSDSNNFLNTSGNFVFPSTVSTGTEMQYIIDDCFPAKFAGEATAAAHYWYVEGNKYWYNASITGYTADNANMVFNMDNTDQIVTLFGTEKASRVKVKSIKWEHAHSNGYDCDILDTSKDYAFSLSVSANGQYNEDGGYLNPMSRTDVDNNPSSALTYHAGSDNVQGNPLLGVRLVDNVQNNDPNYYDRHLKEPCSAKIVLESENSGQTYTYTINLDIIYLKGPSVMGTVMIENCALPGEYIRASVKNLAIDTNDGMPVTRAYWRVVDPADGSHTVELLRANTTEIDNSKADFKALYKYNGWRLQYVVESQNNLFPLNVSSNFGSQSYDASVDGRFATLLVHNYHRMSEVQNRQSSATLMLDPQSGARVYINNVADLEAFAQWINAGNTTEGIHFYLQNNLALPAGWNITKPFKGTLHGDGYVLDASAVTGAKTLFGANLDKTAAKIYNLGVAAAAIASVKGTEACVINCFDSNDAADDLRYGRKAYILSHYHNKDNASYVEGYYAGDDWRYARTTSENYGNYQYLRTGAPSYGTVNTAHNTSHNLGAYTPVAHDYLFFGQTLSPAGDNVPSHIAADEENRVYETAGYYQGSVDRKFYYNKVAWALQPSLTAIDFTRQTSEDGVITMPSAFSSYSNAGVSPYSNATTGRVTQNLLVYNAGESVFAYKDADGSDESEVLYHNIASGSTPSGFSAEYLHLVDMQDYHAPIAFDVTGRAWYERQPMAYRNIPADGYAHASGWEGICLPFTVGSVVASVNGEISHFYGNEDRHHEYWLRGLTGVTAEGDGYLAAFKKPGGGFDTVDQTAEMFCYLYSNTYFAGLNRYDASNLFGLHYATAATDGVAYDDYLPLTFNTPYIIAFPGNDFYEFSMEGTEWDRPARSKTGEAQGVTFYGKKNGAGNIVFGVSPDGECKTTTNGWEYAGVFTHRSGDGRYALNRVADADTPVGSVFVDGQAVEIAPFRTFLAASSSKGDARSRYILISDDGDDDGEKDDMAGDRSHQLEVFSLNGSIIIKSHDEAYITIYSATGQSVRTVRVQEGTNTYNGFAAGMYIVAGKKVLVRR